MPAWFYGVRVGRTPGVYDTWASCEEQIHSFSAAKFKKFSNRTDAENYAYGVQANRTPLTPRAAAVSAPLPVAGPSNFRPQPVNGNSDTDVIYTDGSCKGNGKITAVAGIGVWWGENDTRNISERCPGDQTNNRAELIAIIRALESTPHSKRSLVIKTDSQYAINCLDVWIQGWKNRGWRTADGGPVKNKIVIQYLESLLQLRQKRGQKVRIKHVRGHSGIPGNDAADFEANKGTLYPEVPERDWRGLTAAVKAEISAIDGMPVDENESDDLDILAGGLLSPEALEAEMAAENPPPTSGPSIPVPVEEGDLLNLEELAAELAAASEEPVIISDTSMDVDDSFGIEHVPTQIISQTPGPSSNPISKGFVSGSSDDPYFQASERKLSPIRPLTIQQVLAAKQPHLDEDFSVDKRCVKQIILVASILSITKYSKRNDYELDDGTGRVTGKHWRPHETTDDGDGTEGVTENAYARVIGRISRYKERNIILIDRIHAIGPDYHEIFYHIFNAMVAKVDLDQMRVTKKADAIDGLVMQSQNLYLTPSQPQLSSPPRVMTFMSSERILSSPLQNSPAQVPVGQLAKPADGEETEIDEDEHMEDDDESDDRGDAITINTTSSDDDDYMKEDLHQPIVLSETESDLSGDYHTSREEASPYIHTVDLIEPEVETTHRDPMSHLTTLERAILLLLLNAKGNGGAEGPSRGVHVAAITRAVKHKSERPEDVSDAMDNLLDYGLIATTIDVLHYEPVHLPDRPRALSA